MGETVETVVVGGGQAGLALSFHLKRLRREHLIFERARIAERWRSERWDSLMFQFPNWSINLPGFAYPAADPDGFSSKGDVVGFIGDYAKAIEAPVRQGVEVRSIQQDETSERFLVTTGDGAVRAVNVVLAIGPYHAPVVPDFCRFIPTRIFQIHSRDYKSPKHLPAGAALVVGCGASGLQIAEELNANGRRTYLSVGRHQRTPRRYGGRDVYWWLDVLGILHQPAGETRNRRFSPHVTGVGGGHDIHLRKFAADGMVLVGKLRGASDNKLFFAQDLQGNLDLAEACCSELTNMMWDYAQANGSSLTAEDPPEAMMSSMPELANPIGELDMAGAGITSIIWCTGFRYDFGIVKPRVLDELGRPVHTRGVTRCAGFYFLGLRDMYTMRSSHLSGVGDDAAHIAGHIAGE